jgi:hypothetical protein
MSMKNSIHRIWSGRRGRLIPANVATSTYPNSATWVDRRKTRPFWTLMRFTEGVHQHRKTSRHQVGRPLARDAVPLPMAASAR